MNAPPGSIRPRSNLPLFCCCNVRFTCDELRNRFQKPSPPRRRDAMSLDLPYAELAQADINGDHTITSTELHALQLQRQLASSTHLLLQTQRQSSARPINNQASTPVVVVAADPKHQPPKGRYAPWLKKALAKMEHAQSVWTHVDPEAANQHARKAPKAMSTAACPTIWDAAHAGHVAEVRRWLEVEKANVFAHNEGEGGKTILHVACWHGHVSVVMYVTMFVQATKGLDALKTFVNAIDTVYSRCTPLLETCRSRQGNLNDKLKILRLLVQFGAVVEHQDAHGDNALHWSARMHALPIVRFLIKETDAAVFAFISDNYKRQKPLDVAKLANDHKPTMCTTQVYDVLRRIYKDCNIRLKIQYGKKIRLQHEAEVRASRNEDVMHALDMARVLVSQAEDSWHDVHDAAETVRNDLETNVLDTSGKEALGKAQLWLETKDGKAWLKKELPNATEDVKTLVQKGMMPKPRDMKKAAAVRLAENYISEQETNMRDLMKKKFGREHPNLESREVEYYKRLVSSTVGR
ncbi:Aste57867_25095 [Aphanomyces stellatus]|uniref:Aste57867_25095 protein n=1 Tax=Aphanomyces stellatus TaxID=120398 RepID=A0A485LS89_9STRA|nr:hypothetical protein As57867_025017 [Aphanomyces stellatus]VFU01726.1 Aste57867_25095 [Aphanomyces stellatus]